MIDWLFLITLMRDSAPESYKLFLLKSTWQMFLLTAQIDAIS